MKYLMTRISALRTIQPTVASPDPFGVRSITRVVVVPAETAGHRAWFDVASAILLIFFLLNAVAFVG